MPGRGKNALVAGWEKRRRRGWLYQQTTTRNTQGGGGRKKPFSSPSKVKETRRRMVSFFFRLNQSRAKGAGLFSPGLRPLLLLLRCLADEAFGKLSALIQPYLRVRLKRVASAPFLEASSSSSSTYVRTQAKAGGASLDDRLGDLPSLPPLSPHVQFLLHLGPHFLFFFGRYGRKKGKRSE